MITLSTLMFIVTYFISRIELGMFLVMFLGLGIELLWEWISGLF